ncbi:hypothetical protein EDEG_02252 [Edhazardia aedis USNM 41457]|uniref:Small ribosomal subunit protein uS15 N-terminal domain-containing protein n=1 Tax=Edhazardia aedis (strain USNM 41457) TaxID=1003232 RepID=J9DLC5_EDHAE|nr:hypothetical protein EDEG_02252 [Edhazardia aedis USNM 41457]|eukprot:EJW03395.1 hypothetical protein EDEG_02252 [Edhazardia aedis USNM 41457]
MARLYTSKRGKSGSLKPYTLHTNEPVVRLSKQEIVDFIVQNAKKGMPPAKIGTLLRDLHAVGNIRNIFGKRLVDVMKANGVAPSIPIDLSDLVKNSINIRNHIKNFPKDKSARHHLFLNDSKMYRLGRYYKREQQIPDNWKPNFTRAG